MRIKILLTGDHQSLRDRLRSLLAQQPGPEVMAEADTGCLALQLAQESRPDVVIVNGDMPDVPGIETTRQLTAELPDVKVIVLSRRADPQFVTEALRAGAVGFLPEDCTSEELARAVRAAVVHQTYVTPGVTRGVIEDYVRSVPRRQSSAFSVLTGKEREVLQLLAEGWSTKGIATHLRLSVKTVGIHRRQIMAKLGLHSIAEITKYAIRQGLTSLGV